MAGSAKTKRRSATATSVYALEHHAKDLKPVALMFAALAQMHGFSSGSVRGGNNSWWISHPVTGRRWNVRWRRGPWRLEVGARKVVITSEQQAIKWFEKNA